MNSADRKAFDEQLDVLFGGFPKVVLTSARREAYWRGLAKMPLLIFTRAVDVALSEHELEQPPSPAVLWRISREMRSSGAARGQAELKQPERDKFETYGQHVLLRYLLRLAGDRPGRPARKVTPTELHRLTSEKNRLCNAYRIICEDEDERQGGASLELRDELLRAFDAVLELEHVPERDPLPQYDFQHCSNVPMSNIEETDHA